MAKIIKSGKSEFVRSGTEVECAAADAALKMAFDVVSEMGGVTSLDGHSGCGVIGAWSYGLAQINGRTISIKASGGGVVQVNGHPFDPDGKVILSSGQVKSSIDALFA